ncbi:MAG: M48 family metallopeptidase [Pseudomonadales bacterium]|nr:M48 family metallopeptidase [Pseudomonadales bacterium]
MFKHLFKTDPVGIEYPGYLTISRRKVKWARLKVYANGDVQMVVPQHYREKDIHQFYQHRLQWIADKRSICQRAPHEALGIQEDQLLLFGQGYDLQQVEQENEIVDHERQRIISRFDLGQREAQEKWYRPIAKRYLAQRIAELANVNGYHFNRLFIRAQRTRWGSCSSQKNISLNWKLVKAPRSVSDYVILHELAHTRVMNHSPAFWREVEQHAPHYREAKTWLNLYGIFL